MSGLYHVKRSWRFLYLFIHPQDGDAQIGDGVHNPINGIVQPPVVPPPNRPGRSTNKLEYIQKKIMPALLKHKLAWPFRKPVDAKKLGLPVSQHISLFLAFNLPLTFRILTSNFSGLFQNH